MYEAFGLTDEYWRAQEMQRISLNVECYVVHSCTMFAVEFLNSFFANHHLSFTHSVKPITQDRKHLIPDQLGVTDLLPWCLLGVPLAVAVAVFVYRFSSNRTTPQTGELNLLIHSDLVKFFSSFLL